MFPLGSEAIQVLALSAWFVFCATCFVWAFRNVLWAVPPPLLLIVGGGGRFYYEVQIIGGDYAGLGAFIFGVAYGIIGMVAFAFAVISYLLRTSAKGRFHRSWSTAALLLALPLVASVWAVAAQTVPQAACRTSMPIIVAATPMKVPIALDARIQRGSFQTQDREIWRYHSDRNSKTDAAALCAMAKGGTRPMVANSVSRSQAVKIDGFDAPISQANVSFADERGPGGQVMRDDATGGTQSDGWACSMAEDGLSARRCEVWARMGPGLTGRARVQAARSSPPAAALRDALRAAIDETFVILTTTPEPPA